MPNVPNDTINIVNLQKALRAIADPAKAEVIRKFFKTGKNDYIQDDIFLGITVPKMRQIAKSFAKLALTQVIFLLQSRFHEERFTALLIMMQHYQTGNQSQKERVVKVYLKNTKYINAWDLVDLSAPAILGDWLLTKNRQILYKLIKSQLYWERRIAIVATFAFIRAQDASDTFKLAKLLLNDKHDLIHKAVGWMLREVGKRIDKELLRDFLQQNLTQMPRTALRYAIEHFSATERKQWLAKI
ncbi:MAG: DNA alkylation repair protein [Deltaproteobacteria bacterium]|nr:DNA alkylation repair protein [Deltaproteobacteria bacterium]